MAVVAQLVHALAEELFGLVAEHLGGGRVDDGDPAVEVEAEDAVADGLEDGVGLPGKGAELAFDARLFGDIDAEGEDVAVAVGRLDELVAIGDDVRVAVAMGEVQETLRLAGVQDLVEVPGEQRTLVLGDEVDQRTAGHLID